MSASPLNFANASCGFYILSPCHIKFASCFVQAIKSFHSYSLPSSLFVKFIYSCPSYIFVLSLTTIV